MARVWLLPIVSILMQVIFDFHSLNNFHSHSSITFKEALIAENLQEIISVVDEVNRDGKKAVKFAYEASVCGGIPIIHTLQSGFKGDIINEVMGICNGTTNYMLGKMEEVRICCLLLDLRLHFVAHLLCFN